MQGKSTITINNVNGHVWCIQIGQDHQDLSPSVCNGMIPELSKEDIEPTWSAVKLIFEWLNCLLVDVTTLGSVVIEDANVG